MRRAAAFTASRRRSSSRSPSSRSVRSWSWATACAAAARRRLPAQFDDAEPGEGHFIADWVRMLDGARDKVRARHTELDRDAFLDMEREAVKVSLANLRTFPWIAERERDGDA